MQLLTTPSELNKKLDKYKIKQLLNQSFITFLEKFNYADN